MPLKGELLLNMFKMVCSFKEIKEATKHAVQTSHWWLFLLVVSTYTNFYMHLQIKTLYIYNMLTSEIMYVL